VDARLKEYIFDVAKEYDSEIFELEPMPDHAHPLVEADPLFSVHKLVKRLKGLSSRLPRKEFSWLRILMVEKPVAHFVDQL
jgi:putative transposase